MKVYLDLVFFLNFAFDFLLLISVSYLLKRNASLFRIGLGGFVGAISILFLFFKLSSFTLFLLKFLISILMILTTFGFKTIRYTLKNLLYLYTSSILLGGFLYFLNIQFSYKNEGLIFFHNGLSINFVLLLIFGPVILYIYIKQIKSLKEHVTTHHEVDLHLEDGKVLKMNGFLDTGNRLVDPYSKKPVVLVYTDQIDFSYETGILVPFTTLQENGILKCVKVPSLVVDRTFVFHDVLVGLSDAPFQIDGVNLILHCSYKEDIL